MAAFQEGTVIDATSIADNRPFSITVTSSEPVARGGAAHIFVGNSSEPSFNHGPLALKVFIQILTVDEVTRRAREQVLRRELRAARLVKHTHILPFTGIAFKGFHTVLISPYMKNGDLLHYTRDNPTVNCNNLVLQVAEAVVHLHTVHRIVHGDLKCENVLVSDDGNALIGDFGLSTVIDKVEGQTKTATGVRLKYTVPFAAPELLLADGPSSDVPSKTCETDVYAFGMTILQAFTGQSPWPGLGFQAIVEAVCTQSKEHPHPGPSSTNRGLHTAWWDICLRCWNRNPGMRPSMPEVLSELLRTRKLYVLADTYFAATRRDSVASNQRTQMFDAIWASEYGRRLLIENKASFLTGLVQQWRQSQQLGAYSQILDELHILDDTISYGSLETAQTMRPLSQILGTLRKDTYTTFPVAIQCEAMTSSMAFLSATSLVGVSSDYQSLCVWDIQTGELLATKELDHGPITCHALSTASANGGLAAWGSSAGTIRISTLSAGRLGDAVNTITLGADAISLAGAFLSGGTYIASISDDGVLRIWDIRSGTEVARAAHKPDEETCQLAVSEDGSQIAAGHGNGTIRLWTWSAQAGARGLRRPRRHKWEIGGPEADDLTYVRCLAFSPDGASIAVGGTASGQVSILDVASSPHKSNPRILLEDPWDGPVTQVAFSPSGRHLISKVDAPLREALSRIVIRDFLTGETLAVLKEKSNIRCFACSPDGTRIASGQQDNTVRVWDRVPSNGTVTDFPQGWPNPADSRVERTGSRFFGTFISKIQGVFARERGSEE